jgi:hypothetical protein
MYAKILDYNLDYTDSNNIEELNIFDDKAKQCALIAVDEIINTGPLKMIDWGEIISDKPYWEDVKQEIEAL